MKIFGIVFVVSGVLVLAAILGVLHALLAAWVVRIVWPWFFVLPAPPYALIVGFVYLFKSFISSHNLDQTKKGWEAVGTVVSYAFLGPFIVLGMAWVLHQFVTARPWP